MPAIQELAAPWLAQRAAALEADAGTKTQMAVDAAEACATRSCAHGACRTIEGPREAAQRRGKRQPPGAVL